MIKGPKIINFDYFFSKLYEFCKGLYEWFVGLNLKSSIIIASVIISLILAATIIFVFYKIFRLRKRRARAPARFLTLEEFSKERKTRWQEIKKMLDSENASDWKMAIVSADSLVNDLLGNIGYEGGSLDERLKAMEPSDFDNLRNIWEAHQTRNKIASQWEVYELTKEEAQNTLDKYEKALRELKYI